LKTDDFHLTLTADNRKSSLKTTGDHLVYKPKQLTVGNHYFKKAFIATWPSPSWTQTIKQRTAVNHQLKQLIASCPTLTQIYSVHRRKSLQQKAAGSYTWSTPSSTFYIDNRLADFVTFSLRLFL
jgi:hypothetical protein